MKASTFYSKHFVDKIKKIIESRTNKVIVILGQYDIIELGEYEEKIVNKDTFNPEDKNTLEDLKINVIDIFTELNNRQKKNKISIISFPQYFYLKKEFPNFDEYFKPIIVYDNLRVFFPLKKGLIVDDIDAVNIEAEKKLPEFQAEQRKKGDHYFFANLTSIIDDKLIDNIFKKEEDIEELSLLEEEEQYYQISLETYDRFELDYYFYKLLNGINISARILIILNRRDFLKYKNSRNLKFMNAFLKSIGGEIKFKYKGDIKDLHVSERAKDLLKRFWGNNAQFRTFQIYKSPSVSRELINISQGLVVDTIIDEFEKAISYDPTYSNNLYRDIFLTAPTGAGKSLMFQLPAFYISEKGYVTIIISPLRALMQDQVNAIKNERYFTKVAYVNGDLTLMEKDKTIKEIQNGKIDIIYMAPEMFLSYNIKHFLGERKLGLLIIDEAHLVTTWGRDFRVDYWFLGNHIRKIKKYSSMHFPTVAMTATAVFGGKNDMVHDGIASLGMQIPHLFIGKVKRDNIKFMISNEELGANNFESEKRNQTISFVKEIHAIEKKLLVYVPYTKDVDKIYNAVNRNGNIIAERYHGGMTKEEKERAFNRFINNEVRVLISTKAFGMGVDVSDIEIIYHHAPSGLLADYVQEIGRAARKEGLIGIAAINFTRKDLSYTKRLVGMSSIRLFQLQEVLRKIFEKYDESRERNILLTVEEFSYLFGNYNVDQKILTSLMMIEKDYLKKKGYYVVIARPKKLFTEVFARLPRYQYDNFSREHRSFFEILARNNQQVIVKINLQGLWEDKFRNISFPRLKRRYYDGNLFEGFDLKPVYKIKYDIRNHDFLTEILVKFFEELKTSFGLLTIGNRRYQRREIIKDVLFRNFDRDLLNRLNILNTNRFAENLTNFLLNFFANSDYNDFKFIDSQSRITDENRTFEYRTSYIFRSDYHHVFDQILRHIIDLFNENQKFIPINDDQYYRYLIIGSLLELLELGKFSIEGGEKPKIFVRINDPYQVEKDMNSSNYNNILHDQTKQRHEISHKIFDYFFLTNLTNEQRWNFIEDFFLGEDTEELMRKYSNNSNPNNNKKNLIESIKEFYNNGIYPENMNANLEIAKNKKKKEKIMYNNNKKNNEKKEKSTPKLNQLNNPTRLSEDDIFEWVINGEKKIMKASQWVKHYPLEFYYALKKEKIYFRQYEILISQIRNKFPKEYKKIMGLKIKIQWGRNNELVEANVPYKNDPVRFYKWWKKEENINKVYLSTKHKLELFNKINLENPSVLLKKHKEFLDSGGD